MSELQQNYQEAIEELQQIVSEIEDETVSIDELSAKVKRASVLIDFCRKSLTKTEADVMKILAKLEE